MAATTKYLIWNNSAQIPQKNIKAPISYLQIFFKAVSKKNNGRALYCTQNLEQKTVARVGN